MAGLGGNDDERATLLGFLDWQRAVVPNKLAGLTADDARRTMTASGLSMLGVVAHLRWAEHLWCRWHFAGEGVDPNLSPGDNSHTFLLDDAATVDGELAQYASECAHSDEIARAAASLDDLAVHPHPLFGHVNLRWVLTHLVEETARHLGHLDLMREAIDGRTGD
jgi:hypothetical protein